MPCPCIHLQIFDFPTTSDGASPTCFFSGTLTQTGNHNGVPYYEFYATATLGGPPVFLVLYRDNTDRWGIGNQIMPNQDMMWNKYFVGDCPPFAVYNSGVNAWEWQGTNSHYLSLNLICTTDNCPYVPCCLQIDVNDVIYIVTWDANIPGFTWTSNGTNFAIIWNYTGNDCWVVWDLNADELVFELHPSIGEYDCPVASFMNSGNRYEIVQISCSSNCDNEDRLARTYMPVYLPVSNENIDSPICDCCCEQLVLGSPNNEYENDITPIWIKLDALGSANFVLTKNNVTTQYVINVLPIVKEINGKCAEINWNDVLISDGPGNYQLSISYNISGIVGTVVWGNYKLMPFSTSNAYYTARVKAVFNSYFEKENIDFTDTQLTGTLRFNGFIGNRQPNTIIDNIIYANKEMQSVIRENLNSYEIITDPLEECIIIPLVDLYLLHENELFISDYNYHNFQGYRDLPVILEESAEITYFDISKKAKVIAKVGDKIKNNNNFYK